MPAPKTELGYVSSDAFRRLSGEPFGWFWDVCLWHKMCVRGFDQKVYPIQAFSTARTVCVRNLGCFVPKISCPDFLIVQ